jgi:uncharacterized protein
MRKDTGSVFVMNFAWVLTAWVGEGSPVCIFSKTCGRAVAIEHDGSIYACGHCVYPERRPGNVLSGNPAELVEQPVAYAMQTIDAPLMITRDALPPGKGTARRP